MSPEGLPNSNRPEKEPNMEVSSKGRAVLKALSGKPRGLTELGIIPSLANYTRQGRLEVTRWFRDETQSLLDLGLVEEGEPEVLHERGGEESEYRRFIITPLGEQVLRDKSARTNPALALRRKFLEELEDEE